MSIEKGNGMSEPGFSFRNSIHNRGNPGYAKNLIDS